MRAIETSNFAPEEQIVTYINICGSRRALTKSFFRTNMGSYPRNCCKCPKTHLGKEERVDCEFWPGNDRSVIETYCLDCWSSR